MTTGDGIFYATALYLFFQLFYTLLQYLSKPKTDPQIEELRRKLNEMMGEDCF